MATRLIQLGRWALVPIAPVLFLVLLGLTIWQEGTPEMRDGMSNSAMAVILFSLGLTCVSGLKPF